MYNQFQSKDYGNTLIMTQVLPNELPIIWISIKKWKHDNSQIMTKVTASIWDFFKVS